MFTLKIDDLDRREAWWGKPAEYTGAKGQLRRDLLFSSSTIPPESEGPACPHGADCQACRVMADALAGGRHEA